MTEPEAARIVAVICTAYPQQATKLDREQKLGMASTFALMLDDIPYDRANAALRVLIQTRTWMPSVADIRATVAELERGPVRPGGDAWGEVLAKVSRFGSYRTPGVDFAFTDDLVARCVQSLGWQNICLSENAVADRARFIELYDKFATEKRKETVAPLLGEVREAREAVGAANDIVKQLVAGMKVVP